jgi:hypothetical protein
MSRALRSLPALACIAGATLEEAERFECLERRDEGGGLRTCLERKNARPCPICWAQLEHARLERAERIEHLTRTPRRRKRAS